PAYPDEYIVQVEREIMEEEFDVPRTIDSTSETVPKHSLHLGFLSGDFERQTIEDAGILLQGHALLSGIGIVEVALIDTRTPLL
ncbi:MAG TPA: hypothetical protein VNG32_00290, partial [Candidatus Dormibacteraeota bacterium]|nr:hypothetical protein [Candidatus Dormibacteraeota bacterium]